MAEDETPLLVERRDDVLILTLHRPERRNAFSLEMLRQLERRIDGAAGEGCRGIVLTGAGPVFSSGGDMKFALTLLADPETGDPVWEDLMATFRRVVLALHATPCVTVAAVEGAAVGAGISLCLAADLRVMAADATLQPTWLAKGAIPDGGASSLLAKVLGPDAMKSAVLKGDPISASDAASRGLADAVVEPGQALDEALVLVERLKAKSGEAMVGLRALADSATSLSLGDQIRRETDQLRVLRKRAQRQSALTSWSLRTDDPTAVDAAADETSKDEIL